MVISKKKGLHLNLVTNFCSLIIVTALKFLTLPKFFILLPEKLWFCPNIFLSLPEKFQFYPNLRNLGSNCPLPPGRYGYELCCVAYPKYFWREKVNLHVEVLCRSESPCRSVMQFNQFSPQKTIL